jgi:cysteinyl-tRNA synthetase
MKRAIASAGPNIHTVHTPLFFSGRDRDRLPSNSILQRAQSSSKSKLCYNAMPHDDMFYDGYDVFIQGLQADLENESFDIYDDNAAAAAASAAAASAAKSSSTPSIPKSEYTSNTSRSTSTYKPSSKTQSNTPNKRDTRHPTSRRSQPSNTYNRNNDDYTTNYSNRYNNHNNNHNNNSFRGKQSKFKNNRKNHNRNRRKPGYRRDPTDDMMSTPVDEKEIYRLISLRSKAQKDRNYVKADDILEELNNVHKIYVWDKDGLWSVSPIAPSRRYRNYAVADRTSQGLGRDQGKSPPKQFGRNGHDYTQIGDDIDETVCSLKLHEIHALIAKRLGYKLMRKYDEADEVQSTLYKNGVKIHDKLRQWRADGGIFADVDGMASGAPFKMNKYSEVFEDEAVLDEVEEVVAVRDEARSQADYAEADRLREVLWDYFRVAVDDKTRTFSLGGDFGPDGTFRWTDDGPINPRKGRTTRDWRVLGGMYTKSPLSEPLGLKDEEEVNNLIHDRLEAKRVRDFEVSDLIQNHLYNRYRISVDDKLRQWSVGGIFDESEIRSIRSKSPTSADGKLISSYVRKYNRRGGTGHLSDKEIQLVEAMVQRRAEEMARYNKQAAESILQGLRKKYYIVVDDMNDEWHVRGNDFILSPKLEGHLPQYVEESRQEIEKLIRERSQAKGEKDYVRADEIRSDLMDTYSIKLDDRIKEWAIIGIDDNDEISSQKYPLLQENELSLSKLTVLQLKDILKERDLPRTGKKAELIKRILDHNEGMR